MTDLAIAKESKRILKEFGTTQKGGSLLCPILRVLQMRHKNLDTNQAIRIIREVLH